MKLKAKLPLFIFLALLAAAAAGLTLLWPKLEGQPPSLAVSPEPSHLGGRAELTVEARDAGRGVARIRALLRQGGKDYLLGESILPKGPDGAGPEQAELKLKIEPLELGLAQGEAQLILEARDRSWRDWLAGNTTQQVIGVSIDTKPPRLVNLSRIIYLNHGGSGVAVFTVDEPEAQSGVLVGEHRFFAAQPWPDDPKARVCYFGYPATAPAGLPVRLWARDAAGNEVSAGLNVHFKETRFRHDRINLSDRFLNMLPSLIPQEPPAGVGTPLQRFLWINEQLRGLNQNVIQAASTLVSPAQLWGKAFARPPGKTTAGFGDQRTYFYEGEEVSRATHLGVDLAHTERSPVEAVADGVVRLAKQVGIYGNCVVLDHGQGVYTLYGHLSELSVNVDDSVTRGQQIGRSGATGLALGDHLHFSVVVGGVYVDPLEWWDPHWIKDNIERRFLEAGLPLPSSLPPVRPESNTKANS